MEEDCDRGGLLRDVGAGILHVAPHGDGGEPGGDRVDADQRRQAGDRAVVRVARAAWSPGRARGQCEPADRNGERRDDEDDGERRREQFVEPVHALRRESNGRPAS